MNVARQMELQKIKEKLERSLGFNMCFCACTTFQFFPTLLALLRIQKRKFAELSMPPGDPSALETQPVDLSGLQEPQVAVGVRNEDPDSAPTPSPATAKRQYQQKKDREPTLDLINLDDDTVNDPRVPIPETEAAAPAICNETKGADEGIPVAIIPKDAVTKKKKNTPKLGELGKARCFRSFQMWFPE